MFGTKQKLDAGTSSGGFPSTLSAINGVTECSSIPNMPSNDIDSGNSLVTMGDLIFSFGGQIAGSNTGSNVAYKLDPSTGIWTTLVTLNQERRWPIVIGLNPNEILIAGSVNLSKCLIKALIDQALNPFYIILTTFYQLINILPIVLR